MFWLRVLFTSMSYSARHLFQNFLVAILSLATGLNRWQSVTYASVSRSFHKIESTSFTRLSCHVNCLLTLEKNPKCATCNKIETVRPRKHNVLLWEKQVGDSCIGIEGLFYEPRDYSLWTEREICNVQWGSALGLKCSGSRMLGSSSKCVDTSGFP